MDNEEAYIIYYGFLTLCIAIDLHTIFGFTTHIFSVDKTHYIQQQRITKQANKCMTHTKDMNIL